MTASEAGGGAAPLTSCFLQHATSVAPAEFVDRTRAGLAARLGSFVIRDLPFGTYELEVFAGAASEKREVEINRGDKPAEATFGTIDPHPTTDS